jgi:hypothetical protein
MQPTNAISIHSTITTDGTYVPSYRLKLTVDRTFDGLTPCIFVHEYCPKNPNTGSHSFSFTNVAYYDELTEVKDYVVDKRSAGLVRKSCLEKSFSSMDSLHEFRNTVYEDVMRLIRQWETQQVVGCEQTTITADSSSTIPCDDSVEGDSDSNSDDVVVLSFDGSVTK